MCCIALWPTCSSATACKGRLNGRCRERWNGARWGRVWRADGTHGGRREGRARARGDCIQSKGCNAFPSYTNYFPHARTHAPSHSRDTCASTELRTHCTHALTRHARTARFSLLMFSFLLPSYQHAPSFALVSLTLNRTHYVT